MSREKDRNGKIWQQSARESQVNKLFKQMHGIQTTVWEDSVEDRKRRRARQSAQRGWQILGVQTCSLLGSNLTLSESRLFTAGMYPGH